MPKIENADAGNNEVINTPKNKNDDEEQDVVRSARGNSVPLQIFLIIALVVIVVYFLSDANTPSATITVPPTYTQLPTYTPLASNTPAPTYTQLPTYTPLPTNTPRPTETPTVTPSLTPTATRTPTPTNSPTPTPIPPRIIIEHIQPKGQLVVVSVELARADIHIGVEDGRCSHGADFVAQGVIEAGIDFEALDEDDVTYDWATDSITLHLPAPGITSCRIEYIRQYDNSRTLCNVDWDEVRILAHHEAIHSFVDRVLEEGLLERAEDQAEVIMGSFVSSFTGKPVNVDFEAVKSTLELPSSCEPDTPNAYSFDDENNEWIVTD